MHSPPLQTKECRISNPADPYTHLAVRQAENNMLKLFSIILLCTVIFFSEWPLQNYNHRYVCKDVYKGILLISDRWVKLNAVLLSGVVLSLPLTYCIQIQKFLNKLCLT